MKQKLPLKELITNKRLEALRKEYNNPYMTRQEAYKKIVTVSNFLTVLKSFSNRTYD